MKLKFSIEREINLPAQVIEEKIVQYLKKNFYRIVEKGENHILFIDDEYSDRKVSRSDFHKRIGEGKFEIIPKSKSAIIKLIYLTPILYPVFLIMAFSAFGFYANSIMPMIMSSAFCLPIVYRIYHIKKFVFDQVFEENI